jgi:DNA/RNA endonuclease YhcR with UshA esterase domain
MRHALFALTLTLAAPPAAATTIAEARALPAGTSVTVEGWVTVPPGVFASASLEDQGFAIQDATDGIYVSIGTKLPLAVNRRVRVTGETRDLIGVRHLLVTGAADVAALRGARHVAAEPVATGDVGEETEGRLVSITGTLTRVEDDAPYGHQLFVNDGSGEVKSFVHTSTGIDVNGIPWLRAGARVTIIGLSSQFDASFEVDPRFRGDIRRAP